MLKPEYYQTWADYHIKFFDEYLKNGVKFWGLTVGNEPLTGFMKWTTIPSMGWTTAAQVCRHILNYLILFVSWTNILFNLTSMIWFIESINCMSILRNLDVYSFSLSIFYFIFFSPNILRKI